MSFFVLKNGLVMDSKILESSGVPLLDKTAMDAVSLCMFKPAIKDGKPETAWVTLYYVWTFE